jgi:outer membrane protein TolC
LSLTLQQALREALENNPGHQAARMERRYAEEAFSSAGLSGYLPRAEAVGAYAWSESDSRQQRVGSPVEERTGAQSTSKTAAVNLNWTLFEGFAAPLARKRLGLEKRRAEAGELLSREDLLRETALAYADLARQLRLRDALDTAEGISEERLRILDRSLAAGAAARPDWLEARVDRNADRAALIRQESQLQAARMSLGRILGRDGLQDAHPDVSSLPGERLDLESLRSGLADRQPELRLAETDRALAEVSAREQSAPWFPKLEARAGYQFGLSEADAGLVRENRALGPTAGLQLTVNLFDGELPWRVYRRARLAVDAAEFRSLETKARIDAEVLRAHAEWRAADSAAALEQEGLRYAREHLDLTFSRWKAGSLSYLAARNAQEKYLETVRRAENAAYDAFRARLDLLRAAGRMESLLK